jgi:hypothetical protein
VERETLRPLASHYAECQLLFEIRQNVQTEKVDRSSPGLCFVMEWSTAVLDVLAPSPDASRTVTSVTGALLKSPYIQNGKNMNSRFRTAENFSRLNGRAVIFGGCDGASNLALAEKGCDHPININSVFSWPSFLKTMKLS